MAVARLHQEMLVTIPGRPPTPNESNRAIARQKAWRERREWRETAAGWAQKGRQEWERRHGMDWRPLRRADVRVTFVVPDNRRRDIDNLIGTVKPLLDGIVDAGLIVDDSIGVIASIAFFTVRMPGTVETVFEIAEPV